jgi:hypothetical protein
LAEAGTAAEGFEAVFPYDPTRNDPRWLEFNKSFDAKFHEQPEQIAALAYDAMNALLDSICKAGLNRTRIHDALADIGVYDGVTGHMVFDPNQKNVAPMFLGTVHNGAITYRVAKMDKEPAPAQTAEAQPVPYARVGEDGVSYSGPTRPDVPQGPLRIVLFGPQADQIATSPPIQAAIAAKGPNGRAWEILSIASDQSWGAASTQLVHALWDEHALAIVAMDRNSAHLSEQLALKAFVPVIALSDDKALTSTNVPWVFRLPSNTKPAAVLHLIEEAVEHSGPNPERLRDALASGNEFGGLAFVSTGEPKAP